VPKFLFFIFLFLSSYSIASDYELDLESLDGLPMFEASPLLFDAMDGTQQTKPDSNLLKPLDDSVGKLLSFIPNDNLKRGLETYRRIISAEEFINDRELGETNKGIALHFAKMIDSNNCFSNIAHQFYSDINELDQKYRKEEYENLPGVIKDERASLAMSSGDRKHKDLKPGWMMKMAMKYAGNDPNIAMRLIAMCGHDDVNQGDFHYKKKVKLTGGLSKESYIKAIDQYSEEQVTYYENTIMNLKDYEMFKEFYQGEGTPSKSLHKRALAETRDNLEKYKKELKDFKQKLIEGKVSLNQKRKLNCPEQNSVFYLAKSLGSEVDLDKEFLDKLVSIQAPNHGAKSLPSKSYHFYMSAYMSCRLIEEGIHPFLAKQIQKMAAWSYRTVRMNSILATHTKLFNFTSELEQKYLRKINVPVLTRRGPRVINRKAGPGKKALLISYINEYRKKCNKDPLFEHYTSGEELYYAKPEVISKNELESVCKNKDPLLDGVYLPYTNDELDAHLTKSMDKWDAAIILDNETLGGGSFFNQFDIPHTDMSLFSSSNLVERPLTRSDFLPRYKIFPPRIDNPKDWPLDRLEKAAKKAATYLMDWQWTVKQHEIGANFGAKNCKPNKIAENFDDRACKYFTPKEEGCGNGIPDNAVFDESSVKGVEKVIDNFEDWN